MQNLDHVGPWSFSTELTQCEGSGPATLPTSPTDEQKEVTHPVGGTLATRRLSLYAVPAVKRTFYLAIHTR